MKQLKITGVFCLVIETTLNTFLVMPVMFILLEKLTFDGKFYCYQQIQSFLITP
jgi:hypothetical protein